MKKSGLNIRLGPVQMLFILWPALSGCGAPTVDAFSDAALRRTFKSSMMISRQKSKRTFVNTAPWP